MAPKTVANNFTTSAWVWLAILLIVVMGLYMRVWVVLETEVSLPFRADAGEYYMYAYNLNHYGVYSKSFAGYMKNNPAAIKPDAYRTPGYPFFLALFVHGRDSSAILLSIALAQALLSVAVIFMTYKVCLKFLPPPGSLLVAALTALSPHLINLNVYILSESLFTFMVLAVLWRIGTMKDSPGFWPLLVCGILLGVASMVRPVLQYFVVAIGFLMVVSYGFRNGTRMGVYLLAGFMLVFAPWLARNQISVGTITDDSVKYYNIKFGMYPGLMYKDDPKTLGYPYVHDPRASEVKPELGSVLKELKRRFASEPARHLQWYLVGKPAMLFSWKMVVGAGETFIYPVLSSPYMDSPFFKLTRAAMKFLHAPLMVLGVLGSLLIWVPNWLPKSPGNRIFLLRALSLLVLYFMAIHTLSFPLPRYSIPIRPVMYCLAIFTIFHSAQMIRLKLTGPKESPRQ